MTEPTDKENQVSQTIRLDIHVDELEDGTYRAYEPSSSADFEGIGESPPEAVENYALAVRSEKEMNA